MVKAAKQEEMKQLEYVLVAHRCVGVTAHIVEKGCVRLRFETSYKGRAEERREQIFIILHHTYLSV